MRCEHILHGTIKFVIKPTSPSETPPVYAQASIKTADNLRSMAQSTVVRDVSQLSLPEVEAAIDIIAKMAPAGNVPGLILNGLVRSSDHRPAADIVQRDVNLLFKGVEAALDKAVYTAVFAGPAAILWGYQNLLKLAGKDTTASFPEGLWQFYTGYALREDTARHTCETNGLDEMLAHHTHITLSPGDRLTAWVMAAVTLLHQYPDLLRNEWRERVYLGVLEAVMADLPTAAQFTGLTEAWWAQRPFGRGADADPGHSYAQYRRLKFDQFLEPLLRELDLSRRQMWQQQVQLAKQELAAYQQQLSILAALEPGHYGETRHTIPLTQAQVGLILQGRYYLLPVCTPGTANPIAVTTVRQLITALMNIPTAKSASYLMKIAGMQRAANGEMRRHANQTLRHSLEQLSHAPILINADGRSAARPLSEIRQAERGVGDHAITLFDTGQSAVFDCSHIFFDGMWATDVAEILTQEAMSWAIYLHSLPAATSGSIPKPLLFPFESADRRYIEQSPQTAVEVSAATDIIDVRLLQTTRQAFRQRHNLLDLTVYDFLILYRAMHALWYRPNPDIWAEINLLGQNRHMAAAARMAQSALATPTNPPPIQLLLPASPLHPSDRIYPIVLEVPLQELNLLPLHEAASKALYNYQQGLGDPTALYEAFAEQRQAYLAALAGFGQVMRYVRQAAATGESASATSIKMHANLPGALQRLVENIPNRHEVLHDMVRGRDLFYMAGDIGQQRSLTRYNPPKDDSPKKELVWGMVMNGNGRLQLSLRDFRPHVAELSAAGQRHLAERITQDYLNTFARGFNDYLREVRRIALTSQAAST